MRTAACLLALLAAACNDGVTCDTTRADLGELCLPSTIAPDIPAELQVRELCGPGCADLPSCDAVYRNGQVVLQTEQEVCSTSFNSNCIDQGCQQRTIRCVLPALPAGDYTLLVPGGPSRTIRVAAGGSASCRFPATGGGVQ